MASKHCSCDKLTLKPPLSFIERILMLILPHFDIVKTIKTAHGKSVTVLYLRRFYIWRSSWIGLNFGEVYLHKIYRSDDDPDPHDHPWNFRTFVLSGGYTDESYLYVDDVPGGRRIKGFDEVVTAPATRYRKADHIHRVILTNSRPAWTIIVTSGYRYDEEGKADWCFVKENRMVPWREYLGLTKGEDHGG